MEQHKVLLYEYSGTTQGFIIQIQRDNRRFYNTNTVGQHKSKKVKQSQYRPGQALSVPEVEASRFQNNRHMKLERVSALHTGHLYPPENIPGIHFC